MAKRILGLDLGTNSIGWALIEQDFENKEGKILGMGSRIIPMSQDILGDFGKGNSISQTAERTRLRSIRRLHERYLLRRQRLHRVLNILGFLPSHYSEQIDFKNRLGQFLPEKEPKLPYNNDEFIFNSSFNEMLEDFKVNNPDILKNEKGEAKLIPYDWTQYYLRKKALSQRIEREELAWIILKFNQKRGYYQLRGQEEEETPDKLVEFYSLKVVDVKADEQRREKAEVWYSVVLENGWVYRRSSKIPLFDWKDKIRDFIVTTDLNVDGSIKMDKEGNERRSFRVPNEDDWTLLKKKTENEIQKSQKTVGVFIYDHLLQNPKQKVNGKLVRTIDRKLYKDELKQILLKQKEFHSELIDEGLFNKCLRELYKNNDDHRVFLGAKDIIHLFLEDIIFYQRPLKSQKSSISNCILESRKYKNSEGVEMSEPLKASPKSHPLYQEFRLWQWISNLRIYKREDDSDVTSVFFNTPEVIEELFGFLNDRKEIKQDILLRYLLERTGLKGKLLTSEISKYRWNYLDDKEKIYPCNETRASILSRLDKVQKDSIFCMTPEIEEHLWHIVYSVSDKTAYEKALKTFAQNYNLDVDTFFEGFRKFPPFKNEYGSYSQKALKKLLPLMRTGKYWSWECLDSKIKDRIQKIINGEFDENIKIVVREKAINLKKEEHFQGLPLWLANYIVYDRHSEASVAEKWNSIKDLENYLNRFRQHSLRNPIVEQVITETLRVVKDIWYSYGNGAKDFFNEIHIELGRDMKSTSEERKRQSNQIFENESTNLRIKLLLAELGKDKDYENVRPYSPMQQEILKIYEEGVLNSDTEVPEDILKISKTAQPSGSELQRYKLWLQQGYRSPYTGKMIPLNRLFTSDYEIEHIIPQSRYFDDSSSNKVICEAAVNKLKENMTGLEFIKKHHGTIVEIGGGKTVKVFEVDVYEEFVKRNYAKNRSKRNKLLMEDIPEKMIERQINDTRYISKYISSILSNIVRGEKNDDGVNSKNVIPVNGRITSELKKDWGLNDVWNDLIFSRFERMDKLTNSSAFTVYNEKFQKYLPTVPIEYSKGFQKKRIDHRHHALDALIIASATRDHVNLLNNKHAKSSFRFDLNRKLRKFETVRYHHPQTGERVEKEIPKDFIKPWDNFTEEAKNTLEKVVVSFKQNLRVINKTSNSYQSYRDESGSLRIGKEGKAIKGFINQIKGNSWAIRKPMHKDTVAGLVSLRKKRNVSLSSALDIVSDIAQKDLRQHIESKIKRGFDKKKLLSYFKELNNQWNEQDISKVEVYYWDHENVASRVSLNDSFSEKVILESIADSGIQKILLRHLSNYKGKCDEKGKPIAPELLAFSPEGIEEMNKNIRVLNDGKFHQPIYKVRTYEPKGNKFPIGVKGNKKYKYVEAAKGTNLFFAIYKDNNGKRYYETIPLNIIVERQKQGLLPVPEKSELGYNLFFYLSPNDLVYVPKEDELQNVDANKFLGTSREMGERIYKVVSFSSTQCFFIRHDIANCIVNKGEFSPLNKMEKSIDGLMIKDCCWKLNVDRQGKIKNVIK